MKYFMMICITLILIAGCGSKQLTEEELFARAQQYENASEFEKAITDYTAIIDLHPESDNRYKAIFMIGFLSYENLKDSERAISYFDRLLAEYPESDLSDDAQALKKMALEGKDLLSVFEDSVQTR
jgi:outer membrane protein assembly factor BamD (BamD/ComL family)